MDKDLYDRLKHGYTSEDIEYINKAYEFAENAHRGQARVSGEAYIIHPVQVALILADLGMDASTICAGLLHDVLEDTDYTYDDLAKLFGVEIADLVEGVTKLGKLEFQSKKEAQAENLRKMFIAMAKDVRVIMIKLADRLHNMRTLRYLDRESQIRNAKETMEIYAPLAHRLGIFKIKWELEDISLRYLDPEAYYDLVDKVAAKRNQREEYINQVITTLKERIAETGIEATVDGRPKHFYSIYKKMKYQGKAFEQIYDLMAVRVIVNTVRDCYAVLGLIHTIWKPIPGRFKDYIAVPKPNMYQSLHTTVVGPQGEPVEIQVRTWDMHRTAEYGIAAHWKYKEGRLENTDLDSKLAWLRQILEWQSDDRDADEFVESLKVDLFSDEVLVFTPKGDVIDLPKGSTPLDFAYAIHSAVGNRCIGAKVNGKIVPLDSELQTGDIVEILTSPTVKGPSLDWLKIVKTSQAKSKINQWFKKEQKAENIAKGRELLEREAKKYGLSLGQLTKPEWIEPIIKKYSFRSFDDIYAAVGYGALTPHQVLARLVEDYRQTQQSDEKIIETINKAMPETKQSTPTTIKVSDIDNVMMRISKCCNPVPGDEIVGYITRGRGISIHRKDCPNVRSGAFEPERLIDVKWDEAPKTAYDAGVQVTAQDRFALLADITNTISESKIMVTSINAKSRQDGIAVINLTVQITGLQQLDKLMKQLRKLPKVINVERVNAS
ncbi:MAG: diphosphokinase / guanosine-3,5-bis(diphosphate) 3-diphosphatase [Clostridiales bacterium]|jgi:GTP pyrophosphokinase|nr:diphosphokinase / guanosine-3,5-bis(diphosphate) 3-diphosphatase [Clostridiales bacterium]MDK2991067.1 diphosphokinase / guanosine-3,5-bis(diphosphate) 3-diphosphatase [Clostridiales bacterium]